ncbi:hypothetical protein BC831DRAFT_72552 [Entophlyctis helioformis]|nr:hypothetical protein BC831DRAFT_72552 [Entophlyctis helioformis]
MMLSADEARHNHHGNNNRFQHQHQHQHQRHYSDQHHQPAISHIQMGRGAKATPLLDSDDDDISSIHGCDLFADMLLHRLDDEQQHQNNQHLRVPSDDRPRSIRSPLPHAIIKSPPSPPESRVACVCGALEHPGRDLFDESFEVPLMYLASSLFGDSGPQLHIRASVDRGAQDLAADKWSEPAGTGDHRFRSMAYMLVIKNAVFGTLKTRGLEDQTLLRNDPEGCVFEAVARTPDVPYGGIFSMHQRICLSRIAVNRTRVRIHARIEFAKRLFLQETIRMAAMAGIVDFVQILKRLLTLHIESDAAGIAGRGAAALASGVMTPTSGTGFIGVIDDYAGQDAYLGTGSSHDLASAGSSSTASQSSHRGRNRPQGPRRRESTATNEEDMQPALAKLGITIASPVPTYPAQAAVGNSLATPFDANAARRPSLAVSPVEPSSPVMNSPPTSPRLPRSPLPQPLQQLPHAIIPEQVLWRRRRSSVMSPPHTSGVQADLGARTPSNNNGLHYTASRAPLSAATMAIGASPGIPSIPPTDARRGSREIAVWDGSRWVKTVRPNDGTSPPEPPPRFATKILHSNDGSAPRLARIRLFPPGSTGSGRSTPGSTTGSFDSAAAMEWASAAMALPGQWERFESACGDHDCRCCKGFITSSALCHIVMVESLKQLIVPVVIRTLGVSGVLQLVWIVCQWTFIGLLWVLEQLTLVIGSVPLPTEAPLRPPGRS